MGFTYTAASLEAQVKQELGGDSLSSAQQGAVRNCIQEALIDVWHARPWSFRKRRMTVTLAPSTPSYELPSNFDSMSLTEIYRKDADDDEIHCMVAVPDAEFEKEYYGSASSAEPTMFRITQSTVSGTYVAILEGAPPTDDTYTYAGIEYFCAATEISFTSTTVVENTPNMPTEFHDLWHERAVALGAGVLGQTETGAVHDAQYEKKLTRAIKHRDDIFPKGPPRGLSDPYGDVNRLGL